MELQNLTSFSEFLLLSLSYDLNMQPFIYGLLLFMYLVIILGNLLILVVSSDPHLHTPMYFFISNLSLADIGFSTATVPKMLVNIQAHSKSITYASCLTQISFFFFFGCLDSLLLAVMAYDPLVAICHLLHYRVIMKPCICGLLVLVSFFNQSFGLPDSLLDGNATYFLQKDAEIPHFFCDVPKLHDLACSVNLVNDIVIFFVGTISGFLPMSGIVFSYYRIVTSILRVSLSSGRYKAFSTCGSHLLVGCLFYGTGFGVYLSSAVSPSPRKDAVVSVMYTVLTPMLNPFIYSQGTRTSRVPC